MYQVKEFRAFLCMGRCRSLGPLSSFPSLCISAIWRQHPVFFLSAHLRERLQLGSFAFSKTSLEHLEIHGSRDQIANICWIMEKAREFQKNICFCFIDYAKAFDRVDHNKLWKILKEMGIPDHLTCLLRNVYAGQEATIRTGRGTTDWFQIGKGVRQGCILSPCLFNLYAEYIMRNAGWRKPKLESRLPGEISITSYMQMTPPLWLKVKKN